MCALVVEHELPHSCTAHPEAAPAEYIARGEKCIVEVTMRSTILIEFQLFRPSRYCSRLSTRTCCWHWHGISLNRVLRWCTLIWEWYLVPKWTANILRKVCNSCIKSLLATGIGEALRSTAVNVTYFAPTNKAFRQVFSHLGVSQVQPCARTNDQLCKPERDVRIWRWHVKAPRSQSMGMLHLSTGIGRTWLEGRGHFEPVAGWACSSESRVSL